EGECEPQHREESHRLCNIPPAPMKPPAVPRLALAVLAAAAGVSASSGTDMSFADARASIEAHRAELPSELKSLDATALETAWPAWVTKRNSEIRARLAQGDEDSIVNLWLYGTSFTKLPRVTDRKAAELAKREAIEDLLVARLDDFVAALAAPGTNERLRFARDLVTRKGIDLATAAGRDKAEEYLVGIRERTIAEHERYLRAAAAPPADGPLSGARGLSPRRGRGGGFARGRARDALAGRGRPRGGRVAGTAFVAPGLHSPDRAGGSDFSPPQTIQPFAV